MGGLIKKNVVHELRREGSCSFHESSVLFCPFNLCRNCRGVRVVRRLQKKRKRLFNTNRSKTLLFHYYFSGGTLNSNAGNFEKVNSWREEKSRLRSDHQTTSNIITSMSTCQQHTLAGKHTQKVPDSIMKRWKDMISTFLENLYPLLEKERGLLLLVWSFSPFLF